jgi:hypothetical protein
MNEGGGTTVADATGNNRTGTASLVTLSQAGKHGLAYQFGGALNSKIVASAALTAAIDPREFSVSFWVKVNANPALQVRLHNMYMDFPNEYSALECNSGTSLNIFIREPSGDQDISATVPGHVTDGEWCHIIFFNSELTDTVGVYFNAELRQIARTQDGCTPPVSSGWPEVASWLDGYMQHIVWFNRKLNQAEATALYQAGLS